MLFARICLIVVLACSFTARAADSFTKDQTVVILVGLPGDMESEKAYGDDVTKLLKIFNNPAMTPNHVLLLSNLSALSIDKTSYPLDKLPNDRASFLALADKLKAAPSPVVVAFGHGGMQGTMPVFHVPGQRLTPADFSSVASESPASTWLLFFPGSGAFASALQSDKRTILASEADKAYTQDPISFALLVNILNTETSLDHASSLLGAATDQWYTSRKLARTEEPALWIDGQTPRKLIGAPTEAAADNPPLPANAAPKTPLAADDAWKNIQPIEPRDYPQADAVILLKRVSYLIDDQSQVIEEEESFLQILTREGKRFGDFDFSFSPPSEDITFSACEVRRASGEIEQVDPDSIHDSTVTAPEGYTAPSKKVFSMPHAEPGSILHVKLQRISKHFSVPHVFEQIPLTDENPIVSLKIEVGIPAKSAFHFKFCQQASTDPVVTTTQYGSAYHWEFQNIAAAPQEQLIAMDASPVLAISTFPDWAAFADWYRRLIRESDTITPEIQAEANDLIKNAKTDREKIAAVTQFVTNFRYVSIPLGVNSYRPHAAANILKSRYGDCKDKANLLNTMLKSLGYDTSLVLVPRFAQAYEDLPGFAFNHAISRVKLNGETLWIDSTDDVCHIGLLPPGDPGRRVLVVNDAANTLAELPKPDVRDHRLMLKMSADFPDAARREARVQIDAQTQGYADYLLRAVAKAWNVRAKSAPLLTGAFSPSSGVFEAKEQTASDVSALEQNFSWKADGSWSGLESQLPQSATRLLRFPGWLPREWQVALTPRTMPLHLNEGYPIQINETCAFYLPAGAHDLKLPEPQHEDNAVLSWKLAWTQISPTEVDASLDLTLLKADLDSAATDAFQSSCRHLQDTLQDGFSFQIK